MDLRSRMIPDGVVLHGNMPYLCAQTRNMGGNGQVSKGGEGIVNLLGVGGVRATCRRHDDDGQKDDQHRSQAKEGEGMGGYCH